VQAQLLARCMSSVSLLASFLEGEERVGIEIRSDGLIEAIVAEAIQVGEVRGFLTNSSKFESTYVPEKTDSDLKGFLGKEGFFRVNKVLYNITQPVTSAISIIDGDIISELKTFMEKSEQIPSAISLKTKVDLETGKIEFSGGALIQTMPDAPVELLPEVKDLMEKNSLLDLYMKENKTLQDILQQFVPKTETINFTEMERIPVDFFCRCGIGGMKEKLITLGATELENMKKDGHSSLKCVYCSKVYDLTLDDFDRLIEMCHQKGIKYERQNEETTEQNSGNSK